MPGFALARTDGSRAEDMAAPLVGQHSIEVLSEYGISDDEIAGLLNCGVIRNAAAQRMPEILNK
jgi:crotonobetainyl-CoA:carnitine CoA-transferase CaiB-like acyl-CoA transferase